MHASHYLLTTVTLANYFMCWIVARVMNWTLRL